MPGSILSDHSIHLKKDRPNRIFREHGSQLTRIFGACHLPALIASTSAEVGADRRSSGVVHRSSRPHRPARGVCNRIHDALTLFEWSHWVAEVATITPLESQFTEMLLSSSKNIVNPVVALDPLKCSKLIRPWPHSAGTQLSTIRLTVSDVAATTTIRRAQGSVPRSRFDPKVSPRGPHFARRLSSCQTSSYPGAITNPQPEGSPRYAIASGLASNMCRAC
jgi:hypothetical protein